MIIFTLDATTTNSSTAKPGPPEGPLLFLKVGDSYKLKWNPPNDTGSSSIKYEIEAYDPLWQRYEIIKTPLNHYKLRRELCIAQEGIEVKLRVYARNDYGRSLPLEHRGIGNILID